MTALIVIAGLLGLWLGSYLANQWYELIEKGWENE